MNRMTVFIIFTGPKSNNLLIKINLMLFYFRWHSTPNEFDVFFPPGFNNEGVDIVKRALHINNEIVLARNSKVGSSEEDSKI